MLIRTKCVKCSMEFSSEDFHNKKYCSTRCRNSAMFARRKERDPGTPCAGCGKIYHPSQNYKKYCPDCREGDCVPVKKWDCWNCAYCPGFETVNLVSRPGETCAECKTIYTGSGINSIAEAKIEACVSKSTPEKMRREIKWGMYRPAITSRPKFR